tara:strand:- start:2551 stop:3450 length:900 start_codon:yes stop_codon:yes gene_type:complete
MEANNYPAEVGTLRTESMIISPSSYTRLLTDEAAAILDSKTYVGQNSRVRYDSPLEMITPFLDVVTPIRDSIGMDLTINLDASNPVTNLNDDDTENTSWGRVRCEVVLNGEINIQATHPALIDARSTAEGFREVIGFIYAFDLGVPEVIVYHGSRATSCLNLMIFGAQKVRKFNYAQDGVEAAHGEVINYLRNAGEEIERQRAFIQRLMNTYWSADQLHLNIGKMLTHVTLKNTFGQAALISAVKDFNDPKGKYTLNENGGMTAWNFLQALTQYVTDKSYINVSPIKTFQITDYIQRLN